MKIKNIHTGEEFHYKDYNEGNDFLDKTENPADWYFVQSLYCDGSGWNGKQSGYVVTDENQEVLYKEFSELKRTNNDCEYLAFLKACELAYTNAEIFSDSQLVVFQVIGDYKVREEKFISIVKKCQLLIKLKNLNVGWVERNKNVAGKYIEKVQGKHPNSFNKMQARLNTYNGSNYL
jgi:ribonuclease HI